MEISNKISISTELQQSISPDLAWHYRIIPYSWGDVKCFYIDESQNIEQYQEELEVILGNQVKLIERDKDVIQQALGTYYRQVKKQENKELSITSNTDFLDHIITEANALGSSDIHIENYEKKSRIRIRIDGDLIERFSVPQKNYSELVNKIKIRSNLDISEKRLPQDGRIQYGDFDIRVSILPTLYGEKIVMRILGQDASNINIEKLGMSNHDLDSYLNCVKKKSGIILISGPTGSGKTTTLYATLKLLNQIKRNIITIEDPIEYTLEGINQVQLKENIGLTFASTLRSFLRQDPDVIMVGEIRDNETAQMAIRASLTGHLVLSTIHTNSAWGTISRLLDMGVPAFLLANTISCSVAQRLVRKLCDKCKNKEVIDKKSLNLNLDDNFKQKYHYVKVGCDACHYTGYNGRQALYEIIPIKGELIDCIKNERLNSDQLLIDKNINKLKTQARELWLSGVTSLEEVYPYLID